MASMKEFFLTEILTSKITKKYIGSCKIVMHYMRAQAESKDSLGLFARILMDCYNIYRLITAYLLWRVNFRQNNARALRF